MSAPQQVADPRQRPVIAALVEADRGPTGQQWTETQDFIYGAVADAVLAASDAADKAAGIYRVSLDAAIEAAAKAEYKIAHGEHSHAWPFEPEAQKQVYRDMVRVVVTAAVMGGAQ